MLRLDCLRSVYSELENCLVVTIMGAVAAELHSLGHRPNFFYLQHAMGLASSTGLGLASFSTMRACSRLEDSPQRRAQAQTWKGSPVPREFLKRSPCAASRILKRL